MLLYLPELPSYSLPFTSGCFKRDILKMFCFKLYQRVFYLMRDMDFSVTDETGLEGRNQKAE